MLSPQPCLLTVGLVVAAGKGPLGRRNRAEGEATSDRDRDREPLDERPPSRDPRDPRDPRDRRDRHTPETSDR